MLEKQNCWEFKECGREPGGYEVDKFGICSASTLIEADGLNHGINGGRICWAVAGTFLNGKVTGKYASDKFSCINCDFFKLVSDEEGVNNFEMVTPVQMIHFKRKNSQPFTQLIEKRSSERIHSSLNASFCCTKRDYSGTVKNISETGMFISSRHINFPDDAQLDVKLDTGGDHLNLPVRICRLTISPDLSDGIGVEVINPPQSYLNFMEKLRSDAPDRMSKY
ncbi:MAG: PilZ domain-containing protein [Nitrospiraceae bacterium]|nr:MAG: PilZ domain-containing protein [Nitrospiraceae bacterium]